MLVIITIRNYSLKYLHFRFYTNNMKSFLKFCKDLEINNTDRMLRKCIEVAIRASIFLSIRKNKEWPGPKLLMFI